MRERVEDLGRLSVLLKDALELDLFEKPMCRNKDFLDWFDSLNAEDKDSFIHALPYQIQELKEALWEMLTIAEGNDILNEVCP